MVNFDAEPSDNEREGCVIALDVNVEKMGTLEMEELEAIDSVMKEVGAQKTGQRIGVESTEIDNLASVKYVYQERLSARSIKWLAKRLKHQTSFDDPSVWIGTEVVELKE